MKYLRKISGMQERQGRDKPESWRPVKRLVQLFRCKVLVITEM